MTKISFLTGEIFFAVIWLTIRVIICISNKKIDYKHEAKLIIMYINLAIIIRFVFYPYSTIAGKIQPVILDIFHVRPGEINLIPFVNIFKFNTRKEILLNFFGNIALFIPYGIILPIIYKKLACFWKTILVGASISFCIEIIQLFFVSRVTDIDDLILNTLGCAIGYIIYFLINKFRR